MCIAYATKKVSNLHLLSIYCVPAREQLRLYNLATFSEAGSAAGLSPLRAAGRRYPDVQNTPANLPVAVMCTPSPRVPKYGVRKQS